ncbi:MAG TPA: phosphotransferase [Burkholderiales bacterium]|nr:phosphotransferase [Burkholderiales bacterium]
MKRGHSLGSIANALAACGSLGLPAGAGQWYVLFDGRQRPLLVPVGDYRMQKQWLPVLVGSRLRALYAQALLWIHSLVPRVNLLPVLQLPQGPAPNVPGGVPLASRAAIQIGTTGPYQKASALLISDSGRSLALAKIALASSADPQVRAEAGWLRTLERCPDLAGQVPRLLAEGDTADGRRYLVTNLAPGTGTSTAFTAAHEKFLGLLARVGTETLEFGASPCCQFLDRMHGELAGSMTRGEAEQLRQATAECRHALSGYAGPFVLSQGDFAPWNIRLHPHGIFVFDWEYARFGANPLTDILHYHLIQRAAAGRSIGRSFLASVLLRAWKFAQEVHSGRNWREREISALALVYLLDVLLRYCRASGGIDRADDVMKAYWSLLKRRSTWMAA